MNELELFAGAGGGILGSLLLGHRPVCAVEYDAYARSVLLARQDDGTFPSFPVWDDVRTFDGRPWRGVVDVVSGGFPCQDISVAGGGAGLDGERSGLWREMARIVGEVRPRYVFIENSPALVSRGLDRVLSDLAALGFDARWGCVSAADTGAHHGRDRIWILAHAKHNRISERRGAGASCEVGAEPCRVCGDVEKRVLKQTGAVFPDADGVRELQPQRGELDEWGWAGDVCEEVPDAVRQRQQRMVEESQPGKHGRPYRLHDRAGGSREFTAWPTEPGVGRVVDGMAHRAHRIKAIGNGQVPLCRAAAWQILYGRV